MNRALAIYAINDAKRRNVTSNISDILSKFEKFTFSQKIILIGALNLAPKSLRILREINRLRNELIHNHPDYVDCFGIQERDVKYSGQSIQKEETVKKLFEDRKKVIDEVSKNLYR